MPRAARMALPAVSRRMRGGTVLGFMIGLIVGLTIAVVVAIFVTRAPVPFVNKANRPSDRLVEPKTPAEAPDPNKPLYSKNRPAQPAVTPAPAPPETPEDRASILDRLFGRGAAESAGVAPAKPPEPTSMKGEPRSADAKSATEPKAAEPRAADAGKDAASKDSATYLLQAGAFRSQDEAEGMKAKLALLGFEARVFAAEVNGQTMHRVRVGPYAQLDDLNKARARLAENGIEASVVRQR